MDKPELHFSGHPLPVVVGHGIWLGWKGDREIMLWFSLLCMEQEKKKKAWKTEKIGGKKKSEPWYAQKEEALLSSHPLAKSKIEAYLMSRSRG